MIDIQDVYPYTFDFAKSNGDTALCRASYKSNVACKEAIEAAIRNNFDGDQLEAGHNSRYRLTANRISVRERKFKHNEKSRRGRGAGSACLAVPAKSDRPKDISKERQER